MLKFPTYLQVSDRPVLNELKICVSVFGWTIHGPESTHQNQMFASVPHSLSTLYSRGKVRVIYIGSGRNRFHPDTARKLSANMYDIYHCCVYSEKLLMMDRGTLRNM